MALLAAEDEEEYMAALDMASGLGCMDMNIVNFLLKPSEVAIKTSTYDRGCRSTSQLFPQQRTLDVQH
jgi:hypothetical protein